MCDTKNSVLFTDTECVDLSPNFKLTNESHVLLKVPRKDNMYNIDLKNVVPQGGLTCLFAKATPDESNLWHRRLGHVNFKTMNKLVRGSLVRGLPSKLFEINQTCVACQKGKQHRASCRKPALSFMRPFGCPVTILNTIDHLGNQSNGMQVQKHVMIQVKLEWRQYLAKITYCYQCSLLIHYSLKILRVLLMLDSNHQGKEKKDAKDPGNKDSEVPSTEEPREDQRVNQVLDVGINSTNNINTASDGNNTNNANAVSSIVNAAGSEVNVVDLKTSIKLPNDLNMPELEDIVYLDDDEDVGTKADMNNLDAFQPVNSILFFQGQQVKQQGNGNYYKSRQVVTKILKNLALYDVKIARHTHRKPIRLLKDADGDGWIQSILKIHLPLDLVAYTDSDYVGASLDKKSTTGGCQFLGCRLISWQCKKQTVVANSITGAEYIAASNCCGQVLWIQNQLLDYGYKFMQTRIHIDNESTICIVKNPVFHSKTKHIEIRHHFIRDFNEKKLIQMIKIHIDQNNADLLTKAFDV
ncbi:putative ribonuclease H-like domain-containing protein [Tanacetum coccineum]